MASPSRSHRTVRTLVQILSVAAVSALVLWAHQRLTAPAAHDIVFGGDVMMGRDVQEWMAAGANPLAAVAPVFARAGEVVVNLEAPLTHSTGSVDKDIVLSASPENANYLAGSGVSIVTLANNHTFDFGEVGYLDTVSALEEAGIAHTGAGSTLDEATRPVVFDLDGVPVALLAFSKWDTEVVPAATEGSFGQAYFGDDAFAESISSAKDSADFVIVALHFGREYELLPDADQRDTVTRAIDAGADLIIGHHPHVSQTVEVIDGVPVFYSLGNLVFDQETPPRDRSFLVALDVTPDALELTLYPYLITRGEVTLMDSRAGRELLSEISDRNPVSPLDITVSGTAQLSVFR